MRVVIFLTFILGLVNSIECVAKDEVSTSLVYGQWFSMSSTIMKEQRDYGIYLPPAYQSEPERRFPVMYMLDGDASKLLSMSGVVQALSTYELENQIPQFIIVSIPNTNRNRDLTPTATDLIFEGKELAKIEGSGGANQFIGFIEKELIPTIDKNYRTKDTKMLVGMSFGGLLAGHALLTQPQIFSHYLIADATYVWDNNYLNKLAQERLDAVSKLPITVFIGVAKNDHIGAHGAANTAWGKEFGERLLKAASESESFKVNYRFFPKERHGTVQMLAWYHGLVAMFAET